MNNYANGGRMTNTQSQDQVPRGAFAFSDNKLKNEKNVVFNLGLLVFYYRPALILLNNGVCSP